MPWGAPSRPASAASIVDRVGFPEREYSNSRGRATPSWANVVARLIGATTAPVTGSGGCPPWIALVSKPRSSTVTRPSGW